MTIRKIAFLIALTLVILGVQTAANSQSIPNGQWNWSIPLTPKPPQYPMALQERYLPPKEFDRPFDGVLIIKHMIKADLQRECRDGIKPGRGAALACTRRNYDGYGTCTIWTLTDDELEKAGWDPTIIRRHELGHCHGWHHDY